MKLNQFDIQQAYDQLKNDPHTSLRQLAKQLKVSPSTLHYRLTKTFGPHFMTELRGKEGCLLHILREEFLPELSEPERSKIEQWIRENISLLIGDLGLLSCDQESRLTLRECGKRYDLPEMLEYSDFLNDRAAEGFILIPVNPGTATDREADASVVPTGNPVDLKTSYKTSYVDPNDLYEVLWSYFNHRVDEVPTQMMSRLHLPCHQLSPSNSLWGQVDSQLIEVCLTQLSIEERAALRLEFQFCVDSEFLLLKSYYENSYDSSFESFTEDLYYDAMNVLADRLKKLL